MTINPIFRHAEKVLEEALVNGEPMPVMVEIINGRVHAYFCQNGEFGWYPLNFEELHGLLWKRFINWEKEQFSV